MLATSWAAAALFRHAWFGLQLPVLLHGQGPCTQCFVSILCASGPAVSCECACVHVQVCPRGVFLLSGTTRVQELQLKDLVGLTSTSIVGASVADPFVLLHLSSGNAALLQADQDKGHAPLPASCCLLLADVPGILTCSAIVALTSSCLSLALQVS